MAARGGTISSFAAPDPLSRVAPCRWGMSPHHEAILEAAEVVPLACVPLHARNPSTLTTLGLGLLLREALRHHPRSVVIGLGDTATHDCGLGIGRALGYRFLDGLGRELAPVGASLPLLAAIDPAGALDPAIPVTIFCDVMSPLTGPDGAALRFAGQKGADAAMIAMLEGGGERFAAIVRRDLGRDVAEVPGAGAAGGLGAGLIAFASGRPRSGADAILGAVGFPSAVAECDLVVTGEGMLDGKTLLGKGVGKVAPIVAGAGRRLLVIAGRVEGEVGWWEERLGCRIVELGDIRAGASQHERMASAAVEGVRRMGLAG